MAKDASILARAEVDTIILWMWYFARNYETEEEVKLASKLLIRYLSDDQSEYICEIDELLRKKMCKFCIKTFFCCGRKLFDAYFSGMTIGLVTSSISESYHRATKKAVDGTRPRAFDSTKKIQAKISHRQERTGHGGGGSPRGGQPP